MGDLLSLTGRDAIRTPMQWAPGPRAGFSTAQPKDFVRPLARRGGGSGPRPAVSAQQRDPESLLRWFEEMIHTLRECPEVGTGSVTVLDPGLPPSVLAHRFDAATGSLLLLHNLDQHQVTVDLSTAEGLRGVTPREVFADTAYAAPTAALDELPVGPYGYRWLRLHRTVEGT